MGSGLGAARGRGATKGGGYWGGAVLGWRLRGGVKLAGVQSGRRRCSAVWERGKGKRARGMGLWGSLIARARARTRAGALRRARHGGVAVAAARRFWARRGGVARGGGSSARLEGGGGGRPRRVGASARRINGRNGREGIGGGAVGGVGGENRAGRWEMVIRAILQLPKIPGTKL